jgi:hypothetical protein
MRNAASIRHANLNGVQASVTPPGLTAFRAVLSEADVELRDIAFEPAAQLAGASTAVVFEGSFSGVPAVAKISVNASYVEALAAAFAHWGPAAVPEVLAARNNWMITEHLGVDRPQADVDSWNRQLNVLDVMHSAGTFSHPSIAQPVERVTHWVELAMQRNAQSGLLSNYDVDELQALADVLIGDVTATELVLTGTDLHKGNWVGSSTAQRLVDADPVPASPALDHARWVLGGGCGSGIEARAQHLRSRTGPDFTTATWLGFTARERAAAMVHFGRARLWGREVIAAADAAARTLTCL